MSIHELAVGTELSPLRIPPISRTTLALFAGASGDHQPTHLDIDAARAKGRDDVIAHGMLLMAYLGRLLTDNVPQNRIRSFNSRFVAATPVAAEPTCGGRVRDVSDGLAVLDLWITLSDGQTVVQGEAIIETWGAAAHSGRITCRS